MSDEFYNIKNQKIRFNQYLKSENYWNKFKKNENEDTYKFITSVKENNGVEGFRTRLGFRTSKTKDNRFRLSGHADMVLKIKN